MADFWLAWGGDFIVSATGGLVMAEGDDEAQQRLFRRLCTAVLGYVWHTEYGAGIPQKVGDPWSQTYIQALCMSQINMEAAVAVSPPPVIGVAEILPGLVSIDVQYISALTGQAVAFNITL